MMLLVAALFLKATLIVLETLRRKRASRRKKELLNGVDTEDDARKDG